MHRRTTNVIKSGVCHKPDVSIEGNSQLHLTCFKIQETSININLNTETIHCTEKNLLTLHSTVFCHKSFDLLSYNKVNSLNVLTDS